jgi:tetratricopeptide (TPR) repeat protein
MTRNDFIKLMLNPETVHSEHLPDLKEYTERYPYFYHAQFLYLKALQKSGDVLFNTRLNITALYASDKRKLFYDLFPEAHLSKASDSFQRDENFTGGYFDLLEAVESEGGDVRLSLKKIAENLKASRALLQSEASRKTETEKQTSPAMATRKVEIPIPDYFKLENQDDSLSLEKKCKLYISQKKYVEAIEILNRLNLINPEKSIYFADQIRFLEKIITLTKK